MSFVKSHFLSYEKLVNFQAEKFLISGYLMTKIQAAVSYMRVLTVSDKSEMPRCQNLSLFIPFQNLYIFALKQKAIALSRFKLCQNVAFLLGHPVFYPDSSRGCNYYQES